MLSRYPLTVVLTFALFVSISYSQTCKDHAFLNGNTYQSCIDHHVLNTFLHWNYSSDTGFADVAFLHKGNTPSQWISWAINPSGRAMVGSQALVAYLNHDGTVRAYTSPVESRITHLPEGQLVFPVHNLSGAYVDGEMTIYARLQLTSGVVSSATQVWQVGGIGPNGVPEGHPLAGENLRSVMRLDFTNSETSTAAGSRRKVSTWMAMAMAMGVIVAHIV